MSFLLSTISRCQLSSRIWTLLASKLVVHMSQANWSQSLSGDLAPSAFAYYPDLIDAKASFNTSALPSGLLCAGRSLVLLISRLSSLQQLKSNPSLMWRWGISSGKAFPASSVSILKSKKEEGRSVNTCVSGPLKNVPQCLGLASDSMRN